MCATRPRAPRALLLAALAAASPVAPLAAEAAGACVEIGDPAVRLACYDRAHGRAADGSAATGGSTTPAATTGPAAGAAASGAARVAASDGEAAAEPSLLGERWALDPGTSGGRFGVRYHNPNYIVARWTNNPNQAPYTPLFASAGVPAQELEATEVKFQLSFKARLWETDTRAAALWLGYTQQSHWQIMNADLSRPFRETDYAPELMFALRPDLEYEGIRWRLANFGFIHQSNGRSDPLSRSWNRVFLQLGFEMGGAALLLRPWLRIRESADDDDNPDITDYLGYGDITLLVRSRGHTFTLTGRGNPGTGKGAAQMEWSTPPLLGPLKGYVQVFSGYGESLIDYNARQTTVGVGLSLNDAL
jgi:phospholipase A1